MNNENNNNTLGADFDVCEKCGMKMSNANYCIHCGNQVMVAKEQVETPELKAAIEENKMDEELKKAQDKFIITTVITIILLLLSAFIILFLFYGSILIGSLFGDQLSKIVFYIVLIGLPAAYFINYFKVSYLVFKYETEHSKMINKKASFSYTVLPVIAMIFSVLVSIGWAYYIIAETIIKL